ncbi:MAG: response regulator [Candidatus Hydrogenedentes bacterium]|nr:response regulator [Candidatus Hydrogenedentota bacterium]
MWARRAIPIVSITALCAFVFILLSSFVSGEILSDVFIVLSILTFLGATLYAIAVAKVNLAIRILATVACTLILCSQTIETLDNYPLFADIPLIAGSFGGTLSSLTLGIGVVLVFFVSNLSVILVGAARDQLVAERNRLANEIEERKRTQEALAREKIFSDHLIDAMPGIFCLFDNDGRLLRWNAMHEAWKGYTDEELRHWKVEDWFGQEDKARLAQNMAQARTDGWARMEANILSKYGEKKPYELIASHVVLDGTPYLMGVGLDLSERKALEEQLRHAQKMEIVGRLAGGVAHDFNNLLQAILGLTEMALTEVELDCPMRADLEEIVAAVSRATLLVQQLLAFSRKQVIQPEDVRIDSVVADMAKMLRHIIGEDVRIAVDANPRLAPIRADRGQIEQIILNLCINARDAMPRGGEICVRIGNTASIPGHAANPPAPAGAGWVELRVRDSGHGMDRQTQAHIFEPFFTTKEAGRGTGLGLSTVLGIVKQYQGVIQVESAVGEGTEFFVYFPQSATTSVFKPVEQRIHADGGTETILVAEDDAALRRMTIRMLEKGGYKVLAAQDGAEAMAVFDRHRSEIDLVFVDMVMPKASGMDILRHVRSQESHTPVLLSSGYSTEIPGHLTDESTVHVIQKPYESHKLYQALRSMLDLGTTMT